MVCGLILARFRWLVEVKGGWCKEFRASVGVLCRTSGLVRKAGGGPVGW